MKFGLVSYFTTLVIWSMFFGPHDNLRWFEGIDVFSNKPMDFVGVAGFLEWQSPFSIKIIWWSYLQLSANSEKQIQTSQPMGRCSPMKMWSWRTHHQILRKKYTDQSTLRAHPWNVAFPIGEESSNQHFSGTFAVKQGSLNYPFFGGESNNANQWCFWGIDLIFLFFVHEVWSLGW